MTTGNQFYRLFTDSIDMNYGGFMNEAKATRLAKDALFRVVELKYSGLSSEKQYDELSNMLVLDEQRDVRNNRLRTSPLNLTSVLSTGSITTEQPHQLLVGDIATLSGVTGFSSAVDGVYTVVTVPSANTITVAFAPVTGTWDSGSGQLTHEFMYADMLHPFTVKATFIDSQQSSITGAVGGSNPYISFNRPNQIREGSRIRITSSMGMIGLDGDYWLGSRGTSSFYLFTDEARTVVPTITGSYLGGGIARIIISETATKMNSDRRISASYTPNVWLPKFGIDTNGMNMYPLDKVCEEVYVDYMMRPKVDIDCSDDNEDLELFYTFRGLMRIKDEMVKMYYTRMRQLDSAQVANADAAQNP